MVQQLTNGKYILDANDRRDLVTLVEAVGLRRLLEELAEVCHDNAESTRKNWPAGKAPAAAWSHAAAAVKAASTTMSVCVVSRDMQGAKS